MTRRLWAGATVGATALALVLAASLAPAAAASPDRGLAWLLVIGSSVHVASTGWLFAVPSVRIHAHRHPRRYLLAPTALVMAGALTTVSLPPATVRWLLLPWLGWQLLHFQWQNLGLTALAHGALTPGDRRSITLAGAAGTAGALAEPRLLQLDVPLHLGLVHAGAGIVFAVVVVRALRTARDPVHVQSLLFFTPVFLLHSPYAAVGSLTIAHGLQYLLLAGLVGAGPRPQPHVVALSATGALLAGIALNAASHLHDSGPTGRLLYGAGLGAVMAHLVVDAGLWRQSRAFPRQLLRERVPWLAPTLEPCVTS